jgi:hypothetical protein
MTHVLMCPTHDSYDMSMLSAADAVQVHWLALRPAGAQLYTTAQLSVQHT